MLHAQDIEDMLLGKVAKVLAGDRFNDALKRDIVEAAVLPPLTRSKVAAAIAYPANHGAGIGRAIFSLELSHWRIGRQARRMRHQVFHTDGLPVAQGVLPALKARDVAAHCIQQPQLSALYQYHGACGGGNGLGAGGQVEHHVSGHRLCLGIHALVAVSL